MQRELDAANERFKEYERKDVKLREDIKHLAAKHKKLTDKLAKDTAKAEASSTARYLHHCFLSIMLSLLWPAANTVP